MLDPALIPLSLYVHWPWCVRKCPYCDFNSFAASGGIPEDAYIDALLADAQSESRFVTGRRVQTVFLGGGTPSLMTPAGLVRLMTGLRERFDIAPDAEISMEANPGTTDRRIFEGLALAGVNRISLGVQSFSDESLLRLGRIHSATEALEAIAQAKNVTDNINLDIMFALPGQSMSDLQEDLSTAIAQGTTHLSFYELTLEEGSAFYKRPPRDLPDPDEAAQMAFIVQESLHEAGFEHYEVSGYARSGRQCRHNRTYWTFGDYIGIGAGAHGKRTGRDRIDRTMRPSQPARYIEAVRKGHLEQYCNAVAQEDLPFEFMLNALRLTKGVPAAFWEERTGLPLSRIESQLTQLRAEGLLVDDASRIAANALGQRFLSDLQERFLM